MVEHPHVKVSSRRSCTVDEFAFWAILHFGLFSVQPSGPQLVHQRMTCVLPCLHIKDPLLLIGQSSLCSDSECLLKRYVTMTICLTSNSSWYGNQCALEALLNKTNFPFPFLWWLQTIVCVSCFLCQVACNGLLYDTKEKVCTLTKYLLTSRVVNVVRKRGTDYLSRHRCPSMRTQVLEGLLFVVGFLLFFSSFFSSFFLGWGGDMGDELCTTL